MKKMKLVLGLISLLVIVGCTNNTDKKETKVTSASEESKVTVEDWSLSENYRVEEIVTLEAIKETVASLNYTIPLPENVELISMSSEGTFTKHFLSSSDKSVEASGTVEEKSGIYTLTYTVYKYISESNPKTVVDKSDVMTNSFSYFIQNDRLYAYGTITGDAPVTIVQKYEKVTPEKADELIKEVENASFE